ncbi:MAG TPA: aspartate kinase, partial [Propionibacteriaceae bacterium]|nr:aspartate kinase [Propionibacteriaceae bacterium]
MGRVVQKYGGSSVADADNIKRVAKRIVATKREGLDVVVVISAMGDTT